MGFYHPATLVKDAQRHGVEVRPIDVNHSRWKCTWEENTESAILRYAQDDENRKMLLRFAQD